MRKPPPRTGVEKGERRPPSFGKRLRAPTEWSTIQPVAMLRIASIVGIVLLAGCFGKELKDGEYRVRRTVAGDLVELDSGNLVRFAGIRAPALGEPFYEEARLFTDRYVMGRNVKVNLKFLEGVTDEEGRPCAMVLAYLNVSSQ